MQSSEFLKLLNFGWNLKKKPARKKPINIHSNALFCSYAIGLTCTKAHQHSWDDHAIVSSRTVEQIKKSVDQWCTDNYHICYQDRYSHCNKNSYKLGRAWDKNDKIISGAFIWINIDTNRVICLSDQIIKSLKQYSVFFFFTRSKTNWLSHCIQSQIIWPKLKVPIYHNEKPSAKQNLATCS